MAVKPSSWSKLDKDSARKAAVPIEFFDIGWDRRVRWHYYQASAVQLRHSESLSNLIYALDLLPAMLKHGAENDDLITFASQRTIFPQQAFHFPQLKKRAQNAVNAYLAKFPPTPPTTPLPEYFGERPDKRSEREQGGPWGTVCILFPHFFALLVYICFLWVTCFA